MAAGQNTSTIVALAQASRAQQQRVEGSRQQGCNAVKDAQAGRTQSDAVLVSKQERRQLGMHTAGMARHVVERDGWSKRIPMLCVHSGRGSQPQYLPLQCERRQLERRADQELVQLLQRRHIRVPPRCASGLH